MERRDHRGPAADPAEAGVHVGPSARGRWWRCLEFAGVLVAMLGPTALLTAAVESDSDFVEVSAFLVAGAVLFHLVTGWIAGPLRGLGRAEAVSRSVAAALGLAVALVVAWPSGDWIPDNDPARTDSFISPAVHLVSAWGVFLLGYLAITPLVLLGIRLAQARSGAPVPAPAPGRPRPTGECVDVLAIGLPLSLILLVEGLLPLPGDGAGAITGYLVAAIWCATLTLAGALRLTTRR